MKFSAHLRTIQAYEKKHGSLPSASALALMLGQGEGKTREVILELSKQGCLVASADGEIHPGPRFCVGLASDASPLSSQAIPAGMPAALSDGLDASLNMHAYLVAAPAKTVIVPISGDSMVDAGIVDGDMGVIEMGSEANVGDIVAAEVDGLLTLKLLAIGADGQLVLRPANAKYQDIIPNDTLRIHGVLVGLARRY